ncbi:peptidylprolyl isomerase, partial [Frankia nepalensis]
MSNSKTRRRRELEIARAQRQAERRRAAQRRRRRITALVSVLVVLALGGTITGIVLATSGDDTSTVSAEPTASASPAGVTTKVGDCVYTKDDSGAAPARDVAMPPSAPTVNTKPATMTINTSLGTMVATLDAAKAPCTVHAFLQLAQAKYFDDTPCHRETAGAEAG